MSQQGERRTHAEDDWWDRLYDESTPDSGPARSGDTLDDHFDSARGASGLGQGETGAPGPGHAVTGEPSAATAGEPPGPPLGRGGVWDAGPGAVPDAGPYEVSDSAADPGAGPGADPHSVPDAGPDAVSVADSPSARDAAWETVRDSVWGVPPGAGAGAGSDSNSAPRRGPDRSAGPADPFDGRVTGRAAPGARPEPGPGPAPAPDIGVSAPGVGPEPRPGPAPDTGALAPAPRPPADSPQADGSAAPAPRMGPPPASAPRTDSSPAPWEPPAPDAPPRTFGPDPRAEPRRTTTREWDAWLPTPRRGARVAPDAEARRDDPADEVRDEEPVQDPTGWPDPRPVAGVDPATTSTWGPPPAPPGPPPAPNPRAGGARRTRRLWDEPTEPAAPRGPVPAPRIGGPTPDPDRAAPQDPDAPTAPTGAVIRDTPAAPAPTTDPADSPVPDDEHPAQSAAHRDEPQPPWTTLRPWEPPATTPANTSHRPPPRPRTETRDETRAENRTETGDETWAGSRAQAGDETWAGSQAQASDETWTGSRAQAGDETWTENRDEPRAETGSETGSETRDEPRAEAPRRDLPPLPTSFPAWDDGLAEEPPTTPPPAPPRDAAPTPLEQLLPRAAAAPPPGQPHLPRDPAPLEQPRLPRAAAPPPPDPADPPHEAPPPERTAPPPPSRTPTAEWDAPTAPPAPLASAAPPVSPAPRPATAHIGDGPPTYDPEPTALVTADPNNLDALVPDTVLDGARYGSYTLRAGSVRGDSARYRGEPRRDALLVARFGDGVNGLVLVAVAGGARASECAHLAAADACDWIAGAVGRSHSRLAEDIRAGRRGDLKSGLHRLTDRSFGKLRARAAELGLEPGEYTADLRCLLLPADPDCRTRIFFGVGEGGLLRLRDGVWQDIEPPEPRPDALTGAPVVGFGAVPTNLGAVPTNLGAVPTNPEETASDVTQQDDPEQTPQGDRLTMDLGITTGPAPHVDLVPPSSLFRFRASVARPGDTLLLCSAGLAEPLRGEPALAGELAARWEGPDVPGLAGYLADMSLRVKGYADDRTAVAVWET